MKRAGEQPLLRYHVTEFSENDLAGIPAGLQEIDSSNGGGFLCCISVEIKDGYVGIVIPF